MINVDRRFLSETNNILRKEVRARSFDIEEEKKKKEKKRRKREAAMTNKKRVICILNN